MGKDLGAAGVVASWHIVEFVEQRQVVVTDHVAGHSWVAVPVPGTAHIGASFDDPNALDPTLAEPGRRQQRRETTADEQHFDLVHDGFAIDDFFGVRILLVVSELAIERPVLLGTRRAVVQAHIALFGVLRLDVVVEVLRRTFLLVVVGDVGVHLKTRRQVLLFRCLFRLVCHTCSLAHQGPRSTVAGK